VFLKDSGTDSRSDLDSKLKTETKVTFWYVWPDFIYAEPFPSKTESKKLLYQSHLNVWPFVICDICDRNVTKSVCQKNLKKSRACDRGRNLEIVTFIKVTNVTNGHTLTKPVSVSVWNLDQNNSKCDVKRITQWSGNCSTVKSYTNSSLLIYWLIQMDKSVHVRVYIKSLKLQITFSHTHIRSMYVDVDWARICIYICRSTCSHLHTHSQHFRSCTRLCMYVYIHTVKCRHKVFQGKSSDTYTWK